MKPDWLTFLGLRFGRWIVAVRLTPKLKEKGYTYALTQKRYRKLRAEWEALE